MPQAAKTQLHHLPQAAAVYRRWRTVPCDRISDGTRIARQIRLASSSGRYRLWGRCIPGPFRKECSARFGKESSPSLRGASRAPFVSRALLAFLSSDFKSLQASRSAPLLLAFPLQILRCLSDAPGFQEDAADRRIKRPIFAKEKARNAEHEIRRRLIKVHKGAKYGISDSSRRLSNDGSVRANHSGLSKTTRMVTANRKQGGN